MRSESTVISFKKLILIIVSIWIISAILSWFSIEKWNVKPEFAETFNVINSLFSGLALAAIIYTVYLQRKELKFQRIELQYTREELKRTAAAQENSATSMTEQIRLTNFPYLEYDSTLFEKKKCLTISNQFNNVAYDLDITISSFVSQSEFSYLKFIEKYVHDRYKEKSKNIKLIDNTLWGITERGYYSSLPKNRKIIIPFKFPVDQGNYSLFIQYRDILGNNYSNYLSFTEFENYETVKNRPFSGIRVYPEFPSLTKRLDIIDLKVNEEFPSHIRTFLQEKEASINISFLKTRKLRSNNFKWIMD